MKIADDVKFAEEYLDKFRVYANQYRASLQNEPYCWLTKNATKIQILIGSFGVVDYRPPFASGMFKNYEIIYNTLPEMRTRKVHPDMIISCADVLMKYLGVKEEALRNHGKKFRNPFAWLKEGIKTILFLPFTVLGWLGVLSGNLSQRLFNSFFVNVIAGIATLISIISGIMTIFMGWKQFMELCANLFK